MVLKHKRTMTVSVRIVSAEVPFDDADLSTISCLLASRVDRMFMTIGREEVNISDRPCLNALPPRVYCMARRFNIDIP